MVVDIAAIARSTFGAIAFTHANGGLFVDGVTAPIRFPTNAASTPYRYSTKAVDRDWLSPREVANRGLIGTENME